MYRLIMMTFLVVFSGGAMASEARCVEGLDSYKAYLVEELGLDVGKKNLTDKLSNEEVNEFMDEWEKLQAERDRLNAEIQRMSEDNIKDDIQVELTQAKYDLHQVMQGFGAAARENRAMLESYLLELRTGRSGAAELVDLENYTLSKTIYIDDKYWRAANCVMSEVSNRARYTYTIGKDRISVAFLDRVCGHEMVDLSDILLINNISCDPDDNPLLKRTYDAGI